MSVTPDLMTAQRRVERGRSRLEETVIGTESEGRIVNANANAKKEGARDTTVSATRNMRVVVIGKGTENTVTEKETAMAKKRATVLATKTMTAKVDVRELNVIAIVDVQGREVIVMSSIMTDRRRENGTEVCLTARKRCDLMQLY